MESNAKVEQLKAEMQARAEAQRKEQENPLVIDSIPPRILDYTQTVRDK